MMVYQYRVTGNAVLPPYLLHQQMYGTPQTLYWQPPIADAPRVHSYQDISDVFQWQLAAHQTGFSWSIEAVRLASRLVVSSTKNPLKPTV